jgi:uncharacterized membrane protein YgaE (UPF0421/DUF939 family)
LARRTRINIDIKNKTREKMEYEDKVQLNRMEEMLALLLKEVKPELFEEAKPKKKSLAQLKEEVEDDEEELEYEEEEPKPKKKKKKGLFGRK